MTRTIRSIARGIRVALVAPTYLERRLPELMGEFEGHASGQSDPASDIVSAHRALRVLARLPGDRWRNTCLYRSVAECLVLRAHGIPARLCIGVDAHPRVGPGVEAHAWVETDAARVAPSSVPPTPSTVRLAGPRSRHPFHG